jgi:7-keto-8-aminopelargonate synthetase-like enzyme
MESTTRTNKPTIIATDSLRSLLAASGNRWTRHHKMRNIRRLLDNSRNHIKLIWVPSHVSHVRIGGNEATDQAAKYDVNEENLTHVRT